jgi:anion-transporting  ArsA/GET3 family ATPase
MKKTPSLYIFLGAGGVGKTTLSASFALALANSGKKVGLLSIDPAKRLQSALGIHSDEEEILLPVNHPDGQLHVSMLKLDETLKRWIEQKKMTDDQKQKLFSNPYYTALAEKLATSSDTLAAIFIAEWAERHPEMEHLIVDTAPGLHAIDFIVKPEKVALFLDSKLVDWLKVFIGNQEKEKVSFFGKIIKTGAKKILDGLSFIGGQNFLVNFAEFLILLDQVFITAIERLKFARKWIFHPSTQIFLVSSVRDDAASTSIQFANILKSLQLTTSFAIINRSFPESLLKEKSFQTFLEEQNKEHLTLQLLSNYFVNNLEIQKKVKMNLEQFCKKVIEIPNSLDLDNNPDMRLGDLSNLGRIILEKLNSRT